MANRRVFIESSTGECLCQVMPTFRLFPHTEGLIYKCLSQVMPTFRLFPHTEGSDIDQRCHFNYL